jgi:hypothetical protein
VLNVLKTLVMGQLKVGSFIKRKTIKTLVKQTQPFKSRIDNVPTQTNQGDYVDHKQV